MCTEMDKARSLFDDFEKKSRQLNGILSLSEVLYIIFDVLSSTEDDRGKMKAQNLLSTITTFIISRVNKLYPEAPYGVLDFWHSVLQEIIDIDSENTGELITLENNLYKYRENARMEALSKKQQEKEFISRLKQLPKEKIEELRKLLMKEENANP